MLYSCDTPFMQNLSGISAPASDKMKYENWLRGQVLGKKSDQLAKHVFSSSCPIVAFECFPFGFQVQDLLIASVPGHCICCLFTAKKIPRTGAIRTFKLSMKPSKH